ncbi:unnamed protein product [Paramecium octaurelia]|uniref:Uncharacterized protein n=1 Tax=Paramecium octaurelia TaxID=43137 RepID=A0A8S1Y382_PAROT|nr:unnamed protein product [Paramecium octaurelia]CAD8206652.1 unnamed protein product [Paramecium octaurelia]
MQSIESKTIDYLDENFQTSCLERERKDRNNTDLVKHKWIYYKLKITKKEYFKKVKIINLNILKTRMIHKDVLTFKMKDIEGVNNRNELICYIKQENLITQLIVQKRIDTNIRITRMKTFRVK